jgi:hypothetical protein
VTVVVLAKNKLNQKFIPCFSNKGKIRKNNNEGNTNQKTCSTNSAICTVGEPSIRIQTIANNVVNGKEANNAPIPVLRLAISDTATIISAEIMSFRA